MDRHGDLYTFPKSRAQEWRRIEHALSGLSTTIGLATEWHQDVGTAQPREEIAYALRQVEYRLRRLFDADAEWWSEVSVSATSSEHQENDDLKRLSKQRTTVLRQANALRETSHFIGSGSEWEELVSSVEQLRISTAKYRSLATQYLRVLDEYVQRQEQAAEDHQTEPRRRPKPK